MISTPRVLILTPDRDRDGVDYSKAFDPEAEHILHLYDLLPDRRVRIDISQDDAGRRRQVIEALRVASLDAPLDLVAILCHGWRTGIQLGFHLAEVPPLAAALALAGSSRLAVALYACSTAQDEQNAAGTAGAGGFADQLRQHLSRSPGPDGQPRSECWVDAHSCVGDCTSNPFVRRMEGGTGGDWLVAPHSPRWARWVQSLKDHRHSTLRFRFPLMTRAEIEAELDAPQSAGNA